MPELLLSSGKKLFWNDYGDPKGEVVFYFHGMPGAGLEPELASNFAKSRGIRLISPDRPGYGQSDLIVDMTLKYWSELIHQIAHHLNVETFSIIGFSGGGPYAMACAFYLADRVKQTVLLSSSAPFISDAMQQHVNQSFKPLYELALTDPEAAMVQTSQLCSSADNLFEAMHASLPTEDKQIFQQPEIKKHYIQNLDIAIQSGVVGTVNDMRVICSPWGFDPSEITTPVTLWHGHKDINIGFPVALYLAEIIEHSKTHYLSGAGHFYLFDYLPEILKNMTSIVGSQE